MAIHVHNNTKAFVNVSLKKEERFLGNVSLLVSLLLEAPFFLGCFLVPIGILSDSQDSPPPHPHTHVTHCSVYLLYTYIRGQSVEAII